MTRSQKIKQWIKTNPETTATIAIFTASTALVVAALVAAIKEEGNFNEWAKQQDAEGKAVLMLANGQVMTVPKETPMGIYG